MQPASGTIALCDDDRDFLSVFATQVKDALEQLRFASDIACYENASALLADIRGGRRFSILLLDVMMEGLDGLALARELRKASLDTPVIFVSSSRDAAMYGYELDALRYLGKPVEPPRLLEALNAARQRLQVQSLAVQTSEGLCRVELKHLCYVEMLRRGAVLHLRDGTLLPTRMQIGEVERALPPETFFRCHQGYIVNLDAVATIRRTDVLLENGGSVPVSRYRLTELRDRFLSFLNV